MGRYMGSLRGRVTDLHPIGSLNFFYKAFLLNFLWPVIKISLVHSPYLLYLRILPRVFTHL